MLWACVNLTSGPTIVWVLANAIFMRYHLGMDDRIERKSRIPIHAEVYILRSMRAEGLDLSEDGMYVYTSHPFIKGCRIDINFTLDDRDISVLAQVKHSQPGIGMGVQFQDMSGENLDIIREFLAHNRAVVEFRER